VEANSLYRGIYRRGEIRLRSRNPSLKPSFSSLFGVLWDCGSEQSYAARLPEV